METITREYKVYSYDELSDKAKEKAREIIGGYATDDSFWHEYLIEDFKAKLEEKGFIEPDIQFSGFWSQGDGLSFTCKSVDAVKLFDSIELPETAKRHRKTMNELFCVTMGRVCTRYSHKHTVRISLEFNDYAHCLQPKRQRKLNALMIQIQDKLEDLRLDLCHEFYKALEKEYYWHYSEEAVRESCDANEYRFNEDGTIFR